MYASNSGVPLCSHASSGSSSWVPSPSCRAIATFVCKVASWLPGPRDPECSRIHVPPSWSVGQLDEVVPRPERAQLRFGALRVHQGRRVRVRAHPGVGRLGERGPSLPHAGRDSASHPLTHTSAWSRASAAPRSTLRAAMPHPMSTPTADGIDRGLGRDDRPDRRAVAQVGIRHQGDRLGQDRQHRGRGRLLPGDVVEDRRPGPDADASSELFVHRDLILSSCGRWTWNDPSAGGVGARRRDDPTCAYRIVRFACEERCDVRLMADEP